MEKLTFRLMRPEEAVPVSQLVRRVLLEVNAKDYGHDFIVDYANDYGPEKVNANIEEGGHLYVALEGEEIVGCGAVVPFADHPGECIIQTLYVLPEKEGMGIGRKLMEVLEQDELFLNSTRAVVSSSITAHEFYGKLGYRYENGIKVLEEEDHYWMEKFIQPKK